MRQPVSSTSLLLSVALALSATVAHPSAGAQAGGCASDGYSLRYFGPDTVTSGAGLLLGFGNWVAPELARFPRVPSLSVTLDRGSASVTSRSVALAPGLFRVEPARALSPGRWRVVARGSHAIEVVAGSLPEPLPAPAIRSVERYHPPEAPNSGGERIATSGSWIHLERPAPPDAVAAIVYAGTPPVAIQWTRFGEARDRLFVRSNPGPCESPARGFRGLSPADRVELAWVDGAARVSPRSPARPVSP